MSLLHVLVVLLLLSMYFLCHISNPTQHSIDLFPFPFQRAKIP